ncbi:hypothetical protein [Bacteroides helcogenes]|uniref:hypothetical protein n=1 Tax=Bacteroides helcogenes TaxID=290053 RepID=UPI000316C3BC|nr:hypothetical protein [Bacteroides helcogenes]
MSIYYKEGESYDGKAHHAIISKQDGSISQEIHIPYDVVKAPFVQKGEAIAVATVRPIIPYQEKWLLVETSSDTVYSYTPGENKLCPFLVKKPSVDPERLLTMGVVTERYYFMQTIGKVFNFEKGRGFPTVDLMYDKQEDAVYKAAVLNEESNPVIMLMKRKK